MMNAAPLKIQIHLTDGTIAGFTQHDAAAIEKILSHIQPDKLFAPRLLILGSDASMTAFPTATVVRVDFIADNLPEWPFHHNTANIAEIAEGEFRQRFNLQDYEPVRQTRIIPDGRLTVFAELELLNGDRSFFEIHTIDSTAPRLPLEHMMFLQQLFAASGLHAGRRAGGILVINPANIVRFTLYPGPVDPPPNCWPASRVAD